MKVYEIMAKLEKMPAGADVNFHCIAQKDELEEVDDEALSISFPIECVSLEDEGLVVLDSSIW